MLFAIVDFLLNFAEKLGYLGVILLMTVESSFIPFPSEIVIPPAAYLASQGDMKLYLVIASGISGSLLGASINYALARYLGRSIVYGLIKHKFAKFLLLSEKKLKKAEKYFLDYGEVSTFFGRLVPVVRQLISLPAGFVKMPFGSFLFYTGLGAGIWVVVLALLGYYFGENKELIQEYYFEISVAFVGVAFLLILAFTIRYFVKGIKIKRDYMSSSDVDSE